MWWTQRAGAHDAVGAGRGMMAPEIQTKLPDESPGAQYPGRHSCVALFSITGATSTCSGGDDWADSSVGSSPSSSKNAQPDSGKGKNAKAVRAVSARREDIRVISGGFSAKIIKLSLVPCGSFFQ